MAKSTGSKADFLAASKAAAKRIVKVKDEKATEFGFAGVPDSGRYYGRAPSAEVGAIGDEGKPKSAFFRLKLAIAEGPFTGQSGDKTYWLSLPAETYEIEEKGKKVKVKRTPEQRAELLDGNVKRLVFDLQRLGLDTSALEADPDKVMAEVAELPKAIAKLKPRVDIELKWENKSGIRMDRPYVNLYPSTFEESDDADTPSDDEGESTDDEETSDEEETAEDESEESGDEEESSDDEESEEESDDSESEEEESEEAEEEESEPEPVKPKPGSQQKHKGKELVKVLTVNATKKTAEVLGVKSKKKFTAEWSDLSPAK